MTNAINRMPSQQYSINSGLQALIIQLTGQALEPEQRFYDPQYKWINILLDIEALPRPRLGLSVLEWLIPLTKRNHTGFNTYLGLMCKAELIDIMKNGSVQAICLATLLISNLIYRNTSNIVLFSTGDVKITLVNILKIKNLKLKLPVINLIRGLVLVPMNQDDFGTVAVRDALVDIMNTRHEVAICKALDVIIFLARVKKNRLLFGTVEVIDTIVNLVRINSKKVNLSVVTTINDLILGNLNLVSFGTNMVRDALVTIIKTGCNKAICMALNVIIALAVCVDNRKRFGTVKVRDAIVQVVKIDAKNIKLLAARAFYNLTLNKTNRERFKTREVKEVLETIEDAAPKSDKVHKIIVHELRIRLGFFKRPCTITNTRPSKKRRTNASSKPNNKPRGPDC